MSKSSAGRFNVTFDRFIKSVKDTAASMTSAKKTPIEVDLHHPVAKELIFTVKETDKEKGLSNIVGEHNRKDLILKAEHQGHKSNYEAKAAKLSAKKKVSPPPSCFSLFVHAIR